MKRLVCVLVLLAAHGLGQAAANPGDLLHRAVALAREQKYEAAKMLLAQGRELFPADKRFPIELAGIAYREHNFNAARRELHRALKLDAHDRYANDFLGTLYFENGNLPAALQYWNRIGKPVLQAVEFAPAPDPNPLLRERTFDFSGGQVLTTVRLEQTNANLERLDILSDVAYRLAPAAGDRFDLIVESAPQTLGLSSWWGRFLPWLRELSYQGVAPEFLNAGGKAQNVRALLRWDPNKRRATASFEKPWNENPRFEEHFFADIRDELWDVPYIANGIRLLRGEAAGDVAIGLTPQLQWTLGATITGRTYARAPASSLFRNGFTATIDNRFDYRLWADSDLRINVNAFALLNTGRFFANASSRIVTARGGLDATWSGTGDRWQLREHAETGRTSGAVPIDGQFMLSMERDNDPDLWLRGYIGTLNGRKGSGPIGSSYAISRTDIRRRVLEFPFIRVRAGPFFDAGAVRSHVIAGRGLLTCSGLEADVHTASGMRLTVIYGHAFTGGGNVFYTAVYPLAISRQRRSQ